jgi:type IV secretory pathway VirB6-like protein
MIYRKLPFFSKIIGIWHLLLRLVVAKERAKFQLLSILIFILSGCGCDCVYTVPELDLNYTTSTSYVTVTADGCVPMDGSVDSSGVSTITCGSTNTDDYKNRGRWVKLPKISSPKNSTIIVDIYGSVFYCSTGYDNKNPSPDFTVYPAKYQQTTFEDGSEMILRPGELILLENTGDGVIIGNRTSVNDCNLSSTGYQDLIQGNCKGINALGLSIYIDGNEIVTLDKTSTADSLGAPIGALINDNALIYSIARTPNLFASVIPPPVSGTVINFQDILDEYNSKYQSSLNKQFGKGKYLFMVPANTTGKLGFSIAQESEASRGKGSGEYVLQILSTPNACFVDESQAIEKPGQRGALQLLVSDTNPNYVDNALEAFDNLPQTDIDSYYPELLNYIAQVAGIVIENNEGILNDLVTQAVPSISPIVINGSYYSGTPNDSGDIWFKVRDDYYHDNVGHYDVYVSVITKKNSQVSDFLMSLTTPILDVLGTASTAIYGNFYASSNFLQLVRVSLVLYIVLYGLFYTLGLTSISAHDLVIRVIKIAIVTQLFSPDSWDFFNTYFFSVFTEGSEFLIGAATGDTSPDKVNLFSFVDDAFNIFFQDVTWIKISVLILDLVGVIALFIIVYVIVLYLFILARVLITYLLTVLALAILISIAPLFIVMILFQRTKKYFDGWVNYLVDYALQSVFLFVSFYLVSTIFVNMWTSMMSYQVCWGGVTAHPLQVDLNILGSWAGIPLPKVNLGCFYWFVFKGSNSFFSVFLQAVSLAIMVSVIRGIIGHISEITRHITETSASSGLDRVVGSIQKDATDTAKAAPKAIAMAIVEKGMQWYNLGGDIKGMFKGKAAGGTPSNSDVSSGNNNSKPRDKIPGDST